MGFVGDRANITLSHDRSTVTQIYSKKNNPKIVFELLTDMMGNGESGSTVHNGDKLMNIIVAMSAILYSFNTRRVNNAKATLPIPVVRMLTKYPNVNNFTSG